jgi:hypothetical protein
MGKEATIPKSPKLVKGPRKIPYSQPGTRLRVPQWASAEYPPQKAGEGGRDNPDYKLSTVSDKRLEQPRRTFFSAQTIARTSSIHHLLPAAGFLTLMMSSPLAVSTSTGVDLASRYSWGTRPGNGRSLLS